MTFLLAMALSVPALGAAAAAEADEFRLPAGETLEWTAGLLAARTVIIDGELLVSSDLEIRADEIVVNGRLLGAHGAPGMPGATLRLLAASIVVGPDAVVAAGAGGHGAIALVPEGEAYGGHGGEGGSLVLDAPSLDLQGALMPGRGGDGGDAYGMVAVGGDAGRTGALLVRGESARPSAFAQQPEAPEGLPTTLSHCTLLPIGPDAAAMSGANGGDACAHGAHGVQGSNGVDGDDDNCPTCGTGNHPPCGNYTSAGGDNKNGEKGQHGASFNTAGADRPAPPTAGLAAVALGGRGGDVPYSWMVAGDGGDAWAVGGNGGRGGHGGMGGNAGSYGNGCSGGNGGYGAPGGSASATGGLQGLNVFDCSKNGQSGTASASGGAGGTAGSGGGGGGPGIGGTSGASGTSGYAGASGSGTTTVPPTVPCLPPGAPVLGLSFLPIFCQRVNVYITAPASTGNSQITHYNLWRGTSPTSLTLRATVPYTGPTQVYQDQPLTNGTTYHYKVSAVTPVGEGPRSNAASVTANCVTLTAGNDLSHVTGLSIDPVTAPTLAAAPGPGPGVISLAITHPVSPSGPILSYNVYRGLVAGGATTLVANIPYAGPLPQTYADTGLLVGTQYFYQVAGVTASGEDPLSNEASAVAPLLIITGGGSGHGYVSEGSGDTGSTRGCVDVPVSYRIVREGPSLDLVASYDEGRDSEPQRVQDSFCRDTPRQESPTYTSRVEGERTERCEGTALWFIESRSSIEAGREVLCDGRLVESHYFYVAWYGSYGYLYHEVVEATEKGTRTWRYEAKTSASTAGSFDPRYDPGCGIVSDRAARYAEARSREVDTTCGVVAPVATASELPIPAVPPAIGEPMRPIVDAIVAPLHEPAPDGCSYAPVRECYGAARVIYAQQDALCGQAKEWSAGASTACLDSWYATLGGGAWWTLGCSSWGIHEPRYAAMQAAKCSGA